MEYIEYNEEYQKLELTLQTKWTFLPTKPVIFDGIVVSKYGPVPGVGNSCRKSVKNRLELAKQVPAKR